MASANMYLQMLGGGDPTKPSKATKPNVNVQHPTDPLYDPNAAQQARQLFSSPFADSMYAIAGRPSSVAEQYTDTPAVGMYTPYRDSVTISPDAFKGENSPWKRAVGAPVQPAPENSDFSSPERTFEHEMAHRLFAHAHEQPGAVALGNGLDRMADSINASGGTVPGYGGTNHSEHAAEAVANAIQLLRLTDTQRASPDLAKQVEPMRQQFERAVPGTITALTYLLAQPLYSAHPLKVSQDLKYPAPDATAVNDRQPPQGATPEALARLLNMTPAR